MKKTRQLVLITCSVILIFLQNTCQKEDDGMLSVKKFTAGFIYNGSTHLYAPCYWIDTVRYDIPNDGYNAIAYTGCESGGVAYTAGCYYSGGTELYACYWQGTTKADLQLPGDVQRSEALSADVSNGILYTAGYYSDGETAIPCYWTGTTRHDLPADNSAYALSIKVYDGNVYVSGCMLNDLLYSPCYWVNGVLYEISSMVEGAALSIEFAGDSICTSGYYIYKGTAMPCYWINDRLVELYNINSQDAYALSIAILNDDVYTAGFYKEGPSVPCYWKNTKRYYLMDEDMYSGYATLIEILGGDVYITGNYTDINRTGHMVCYWKNGIKTNLQVDPGNNAITTYGFWFPD